MPNTTSIAIVGGGLSGLYAAYQLQRQGRRDFALLEARSQLGGRIATFAPAGTTHIDDTFDLGPTWFWPGYQAALGELVRDLGLDSFEQHEAGDMLIERSAQQAPVRSHSYFNSPASMRLIGGMGRLIEALQARVDQSQLHTGQAVRQLRKLSNSIELDSINAAGEAQTWQAQQVLLALPPRLVESTIRFEPALPDSLARQWRQTATWMAPHAKYLAVYEQPFWRAQGLSGEARSAVGPMGEIHDASMPDGSAALFGFIGVPAALRRTLSDTQLRALCRAQLLRLFGPQAAQPKADALKDWAQDALTATAADSEASGQHAHAPAAKATSGPWQHCLTGIASEWSPQFPGYLAGAIEAAELGLHSLRLAAHSIE